MIGTDSQSSSRNKRESEPEPVPLYVLALSTRAYNYLRRAGYHTVNDVASLSDEQILSIRQVGAKTLREIREKLAAYLEEHPLPRRQVTPSESEESLSEIDLSQSDRRASVLESTSISVLDLSTRSYNALARAGINTVRQLAEMSSRQVREIRNIGAISLGEIEKKLEAYLTELTLEATPHVETEPLIPLVDSALQKRAECAPLDDIPVERLGLPAAWRDSLFQKGIVSVGELAGQAADTFDNPTLLGDRAERYLTWLAEQDSAVWAKEVAGQGISPLDRTELCETPLSDWIEDWLSSSEYVDSRDRQVIRWRYGLRGEQLTLEDIGVRLGISRARVYQLENRTLRCLRRPKGRAAIRPLVALLTDLLEKADGLMNEEQIEAAMEQELSVNDVDPVGVAHLVLEITDDVEYLPEANAWRLKSIPPGEIRAIHTRLTKILEVELVPLPVEEVIDRFKPTSFYRDHEREVRDDFILACLRVHPDICIDDGQCGLRQWERHRLDEMILALREIGEPVHYTKIAEKTNALLEPEMQTSEHNIHAHMQRLPDVFVRVGHGVYGLAEWGLHDDGSLANAAYRVLSEAGEPLHHDVIADRVLQTWKARRASVYGALNNDSRFIRIGHGVYWLRKKIAGDRNGDKGDFGDLFGERLRKLQEELDMRRGSRGHDTHAEADAIREMGTDFFG